jgi:hypothetical protein
MRKRKAVGEPEGGPPEEPPKPSKKKVKKPTKPLLSFSDDA